MTFGRLTIREYCLCFNRASSLQPIYCLFLVYIERARTGKLEA